jgi:hypothetical protein
MMLFSSRAHGRSQRPRWRVATGLTHLLRALALGLLLPQIIA